MPDIRPLLVAFVLGMLLAAAIYGCARAALPEPTQAQIAACTPDVLRLCADEIARSHAAIAACMLRRRRELSPACRDAFRK